MNTRMPRAQVCNPRSTTTTKTNMQSFVTAVQKADADWYKSLVTKGSGASSSGISMGAAVVKHATPHVSSKSQRSKSAGRRSRMLRARQPKRLHNDQHSTRSRWDCRRTQRTGIVLHTGAVVLEVKWQCCVCVGCSACARVCATLCCALLRAPRIQFNSIHFNSIQFNSIQFNSTQLNSIQFNSIQFNSIQFNSIQFNSIQFIHIPTHSTTPLVRAPDVRG